MKRSLHHNVKIIYFIPFFILLSVIIVSIIFSSHSFSAIKKEMSVKESFSEIPVIKVKLSDNKIEKIDMEKYLIGVVAGEMPPSFEVEALKAQAVAARTYIMSKTGVDNSSHPDADICTDPSHCKAYISDNDALKKWGTEWNDIYKPKISDAVESTKGEIITYQDEPIVAVFHSTSAGKTENSGDVWQEELPYLKSVISEGEELSPRYKSFVEVDLDEFKFKLKEIDGSVDFSKSVNDWINGYEYTEGGAVKVVEIGGVKFKGTKIREVFSLRSAFFTISITDKVIFDVTGNGHGVGMSQYGANYAASRGYDYKKILQKYYTDTQLTKIY